MICQPGCSSFHHSMANVSFSLSVGPLQIPLNYIQIQQEALVMRQYLANHCILFLSDNIAVVEVINKQTAKNQDLMVLIRKFTICAMRFSILFKSKHIPGKYNIIASIKALPQSSYIKTMLNAMILVAYNAM